MSKELTDKLIFRSIKAGDECAFEILFNSYYQELCHLAKGILKNEALAEEVVSDVFLTIWSRRNKINIHKNVRGYLQYVTKNLSLNCQKMESRLFDTIHHEYQIATSEQNPEEKLLSDEILDEWEQRIKNLPPQRQKVFRMNKFEGLTYTEIASNLNLSEKTVRNQVQLALRTLEFTMAVVLFSTYILH